LSVSDGVRSTVAARGAVARGGTSLAARCGIEPLAVSVGGGTPSVAPDEPTLLFADGVGLTAAARGGQTLLAADGDAATSFDGGGASESGGDGDVWHLALSYEQTPAVNKPRANSVAFFIFRPANHLE